MVGGPVVDRTSTGVHETAALTPASPSNGAEEPRGDPAMTEMLHWSPRKEEQVKDVVGHWKRRPRRFTIHQTQYLVVLHLQTTSRLLSNFFENRVYAKK